MALISETDSAAIMARVKPTSPAGYGREDAATDWRRTSGFGIIRSVVWPPRRVGAQPGCSMMATLLPFQPVPYANEPAMPEPVQHDDNAARHVAPLQSGIKDIVIPQMRMRRARSGLQYSWHADLDRLSVCSDWATCTRVDPSSFISRKDETTSDTPVRAWAWCRPKRLPDDHSVKGCIKIHRGG